MNNVTKTPGVWGEKEGTVRGKTGEEREEDHSRWLGPGNKVAPFPDLTWLQFFVVLQVIKNWSRGRAWPRNKARIKKNHEHHSKS